MTVELDEQAPFVIVHFKIALVPTGTPDTADVGDNGLAIVAVPLKTLHVPTPNNAVFPANVKDPELQFDWAGPATATVTGLSFVNVTVELDEQDPLVIVHFKTALVPTGTPVTADVDNDGLEIIAVPLKTLHVPRPTNAVFPANVKDPELQFD